MLRAIKVLQTITPGEWFTTIDLKNTYFHVLIHPVHSKFLHFSFQGHSCQFAVLPFGLSSSFFYKMHEAALASPV